MEPKGLLSCSQEPEPEQFNSYYSSLRNIHLVNYVLIFLLVSLPRAFPPLIYMDPSYFFMLHVMPITLDLIIRIILGEGCKLWISSLCSFIELPVSSSFLGPDILLSTPFSNTLNLFMVTEHCLLACFHGGINYWCLLGLCIESQKASIILSLCSSFTVRDQVSYPYKTVSKIRFFYIQISRL
jgi:hypothetical protein